MNKKVKYMIKILKELFSGNVIIDIALRRNLFREKASRASK